jgi:kynurenine formamidase
MKITFQFGGKNFTADLSSPMDLSIPLRHGAENPNCFWAPMPEFEPVVAGDFVGSTAQGGIVNFFNIRINPHGNGTHTECVGHIAQERYVLRECLLQHHFVAKIVSVEPRTTTQGDHVVFRDQLEAVWDNNQSEALIIRTLPLEPSKMNVHWSGTNPPYLHHEALQWLAENNLQHLLIDLPSVDREEDGGLLLGHRAFWQYPHNVRAHCTITELIVVPQTVPDGLYLLNLQTTSLDLDASPSKPVVFALR